MCIIPPTHASRANKKLIELTCGRCHAWGHYVNEQVNCVNEKKETNILWGSKILDHIENIGLKK